MTETAKASWITDHAFEPRTEPVYYPRHVPNLTTDRWDRFFPPNPALCQHCRMAEAAHSETTVGRHVAYHETLADFEGFGP